MATPKIDEEVVCDAVRDYLRANLNAKLGEIDTEKNAGLAPEAQITLRTIEDGAYFWEYLGDAIANYSAFVLYGIGEPLPISRSGQLVAQRFSMTVAVVLTDSGNDLNTVRRLIRYRRALKDIFEKGWNSVRGGLKFEVVELAPYSIRLLDKATDDKIIGVKLEYTLA